MKEKKIREFLATRTVGIAGCGGLGSNCAVALARIGISKLILVDFDRVELSNLNRQYYFRDQLGQPKVNALFENIQRIDPTVVMETHFERLTPDNIPTLFSLCDVVVEAFDRADQKMMLIETMMERMPDVPLVCGSGMAGWGDNELIRTERCGNLVICGDQQTEVSDERPPLAPRVGIVSSMQANVVLEILIKKSL
jgi:sulfur carrier protein ThiS adenylyltransferase